LLSAKFGQAALLFRKFGFKFRDSRITGVLRLRRRA